MSANGISTLSTKEARQLAKLTLAATDRAADGNSRASYDISQLPTYYSGNAVVDNANSGGLIEGRPWTSTISLRSFLGTTGQAAYDAASSGAWFVVSSTDWNAAVAGVTGATKLLMTDSQMSEANGAAFSSGYILTQVQAPSTVAAGNYIFALKGVTEYASQSWSIYGGTTFKSSSYAIIGSATPNTGAGAPGIGTFYYLRKAPAVLASTTYIGIAGAANLTMTSSSIFAGSAYIASPYTGTWTNWGQRMPKVQVVTTSTTIT